MDRFAVALLRWNEGVGSGRFETRVRSNGSSKNKGNSSY